MLTFFSGTFLKEEKTLRNLINLNPFSIAHTIQLVSVQLKKIKKKLSKTPQNIPKNSKNYERDIKDRMISDAQITCSSMVHQGLITNVSSISIR